MHANDDPELSQFNCTEFYHRYMMGVVLTDGAKALAEKFSCFWFLDIVASYQNNKLISDMPLQVWKLKRTGSSASVSCDDGNSNTIITQNIPFTDFEPDTAEVWLQGGVILLPSEY
jgi:hypothetical protein